MKSVLFSHANQKLCTFFYKQVLWFFQPIKVTSCLVCLQYTQVLRPYEALLLVSGCSEIAMGTWSVSASAKGTATVTPHSWAVGSSRNALWVMGTSCSSLRSSWRRRKLFAMSGKWKNNVRYQRMLLWCTE